MQWWTQFITYKINSVKKRNGKEKKFPANIQVGMQWMYSGNKITASLHITSEYLSKGNGFTDAYQTTRCWQK